jgi:N-methylhydantoinase A/oxoprolinase/acetone carboxylase beta subunit
LITCPSLIPADADRGGTFTDCLGVIDGGENVVVKLLSQDPSNYDDAPIEGIRRILSKVTGEVLPRGEPLDVTRFAKFNVALLLTSGFADALKIGTQSRPRLFDLNIVRPDVLYEQVVEVDERVTVEGYQQNPRPDPAKLEASLVTNPALRKGLSGEVIRVMQDLDGEKVRHDLQAVYDQGIRSIAVCLTHSYTFPGGSHRTHTVCPSLTVCRSRARYRNHRPGDRLRAGIAVKSTSTHDQDDIARYLSHCRRIPYSHHEAIRGRVP